MRKGLLIAAIVSVISTAAVAASHKNILSVEAKIMLDKGGIFLLDVRTPEEYQQGHLQGAVLIPINEIERRLGEISHSKPILVYCAVGSRSDKVGGFLAGKGFKNVYQMSDGIVGWYRNGFPISR
jgi:rhodanese-related sulfurtransferase